MDFRLSTEHEQVRDKIRRFCQAEILPLVAQAQKVETFPVRVAGLCHELVRAQHFELMAQSDGLEARTRRSAISSRASPAG
jgi:alkylation response protein AidB-like acyl-CoA dehydrogenase